MSLNRKLLFAFVFLFFVCVCVGGVYESLRGRTQRGLSVELGLHVLAFSTPELDILFHWWTLGEPSERESQVTWFAEGGRRVQQLG